MGRLNDCSTESWKGYIWTSFTIVWYNRHLFQQCSTVCLHSLCFPTWDMSSMVPLPVRLCHVYEWFTAPAVVPTRHGCCSLCCQIIWICFCFNTWRCFLVTWQHNAFFTQKKPPSKHQKYLEKTMCFPDVLGCRRGACFLVFPLILLL